MQNNSTPQTRETVKNILRQLDEQTYLHLSTSVTLFVSTGGRLTGNLATVWAIAVGELLDAFTALDEEKELTGNPS